MGTSVLDSFLDTMRVEGVHDSEGTFTMDGEKAFGKLAGFLLPNDGSWILKVVQAANFANAHSLEIITSKGLITLVCQFPYHFPHRLLRENLGPGPANSEPALASLGEGLRALSFGESRPLAMLARGVGRETVLRISGGEVTESSVELQHEALPGTRLEICTAMDRGRQDKELTMLLNRARVSAVPLILNSRRIDDLNLPRDDGGERSKYLGAAWLGRRPRLGLPGAVRPGTGPGSPLYAAPFAENTKAERLLAIHYHYSRGGRGKFLSRKTERGVATLSRLHLVHQGVVVATELLDIDQPIAVDLFAPASRCDLSGLSADFSAKMLGQWHDTLALFGPELTLLSQFLSAGPSLHGSDSALSKVRTYLQWSGKQAEVVTGASSALGRFRHQLPRVIR